jgi:tetratricopeptide (TPR) repeat protein
MTTKNAFLQEVVSHLDDPRWLAENIDSVYDSLSYEAKSDDSLPHVIAVLLELLPRILEYDEFRRWGRLMETVYGRTRFAESNGLDGDATADILPMFVMTKRPKVEQLPTKTTRRKRIILHPTQALEMYLILLVPYVLENPDWFTEERAEELLAFNRIINDVYLMNKTLMVMATIFIARGEHARAAVPAETTYLYWRAQGNHGDAAMSAYTLAVAKRESDLIAARHALLQAAKGFKKAKYRRQFVGAALELAELEGRAGNYEDAHEWANRAFKEAQARNMDENIAAACHMQGVALIGLRDFDAAEDRLNEALERWQALDNEADYLDTLLTIATLRAHQGQRDDALTQAQDILSQAESLPPGRLRDTVIAHAQHTLDDINHLPV